jgi:hypothetical protein
MTDHKESSVDLAGNYAIKIALACVQARGFDTRMTLRKRSSV